jgi:hypothetical protein
MVFGQAIVGLGGCSRQKVKPSKETQALYKLLGFNDKNENGIIEKPSFSNFWTADEGYKEEVDTNKDGKITGAEIYYYLHIKHGKPSGSILEFKTSMEEALNFSHKPGCHTKKSPVAGSRSEELNEVVLAARQHPVLKQFQIVLYETNNIFLIPLSDAVAIDKIAKGMFQSYLSKYKAFGVTTENAVAWITGKPGCIESSAPVYDEKNEYDTWFVQAAIGNADEIKDGRCLPKYIVAYHELMHVEETAKGITNTERNEEIKGIWELMTTIKTIMLLDESYKTIHKINIDTEFEYQRSIQLNGKTISIGKIANIYRSLEKRYGTLAKALISNKSIQFLESGTL